VKMVEHTDLHGAIF